MARFVGQGSGDGVPEREKTSSPSEELADSEKKEGEDMMTDVLQALGEIISLSSPMTVTAESGACFVASGVPRKNREE